MKTIQLNISNDIFDKVMSFLEILPKNKIVIIRENEPKEAEEKKESLGDFFRTSPLVGLDLTRSSEVYQSRIEF
ncbi:MAG TPA: hypothetical protein ENK91_14875 [Bacteroidetes bacterium]|nr:hypothetical protein [Bacteroidota bacterium]